MSQPPTADRADQRALNMLLAAIAMCGAGLSFDTILVVKITAFYRITDADFGMLLGLSCFLMALASGPWGYLADRRPRLQLIRLSQGLVALSLLGSAAAFVFDLRYGFFVAVKILAGLGLAGVGPVATSAVMDTVPHEKRGAAFGWVGVAWALGGAGGMLLPAVCMALHATLGLTYFLGAAVLIAFPAGLYLVREPRRGVHDQALQEAVGAGAEYNYAINPADLKPLFANPTSLLLIAATLCFQFPIQTIAIWFVTFLMRNHNATEFIATQLMFIAYIGQPVVPLAQLRPAYDLRQLFPLRLRPRPDHGQPGGQPA